MLLVVLAVAALGTAAPASAAVCTSGSTSWTGTGGDWNDAAHWTNGVPTAACDTNIMTTGPFTVTLNGPASTKLLKIGAPGLKTINVSSNGAAAGITATGGVLMGMFGQIILDCPGGGCTGAAPFIDVGASPNVLNNNGGKITVTAAAGDGTAALKGDVANSGTLQFDGSAQIGVGGGTVTQAPGPVAAGTTVVGTGAVLDLSDANSGTFHLNGGTLSGDGSIAGAVNNASGTVAPGSSPGTLAISGDYTQGAAGTLGVEVNGTAAGQFDKLVVGGSATLGGTLALLPGPAFAAAAAPGNSVRFLTSTNGRTGTFATTTVTPPLAGGKTFEATYGPNSLNAVVGAAPVLPPTPTPTPIPTPDTTKPTLSAVGLSSRSFLAKTGTTLKLRLSEAATVKVVVNQSVRGRRVHGKCRPNARTAARRCTLTVRRANLTFRGGLGANRLRLKLASLKPGSYTAVITARDAAGNVSRTSSLKFTIRTPPRRG